MADNYASIEHNGGAGTSQSITVNGTGSIVLQAGSSAGTGPGAGSEASIQTEFGDSQTILFTGTGIGRAITLTGGTVGGDSYAEIYAGLGTQSITGAGQITLTGGASGGGASFPVDDTTGNLAAISADLNDQTIVANGLLAWNSRTNIWCSDSPGESPVTRRPSCAASWSNRARPCRS